jgi:predicted protein tyrosine phosphatase
MYEWFNDWVANRNNSEKKSIIVVNRRVFPIIADLTKDCDDVAYISISASEECALEHFYDVTEAHHYLPDADNVLNLNFDDITEDFTFKNEFGEDVTYHAISEEQAKQVIDFVDKNLGKHLIIHCRAGQSRSAACGVAIECCYGDIYKIEEHNTCDTPNPDVLAKVKRAFYVKNNIFQ